MRFTAASPADRTPMRPEAQVPLPPCRLHLDVEVEAAHLANPALAVQRLLASEAGLLASVVGDDAHLEVTVALPHLDPATADQAESWCRWVLHIAGVRGRVHRRPVS